MKGTEKQIGFAETLMEKMNTQFDAIIADCKIERPEFVEQWVNMKNMYNKIMNEGYAGCVIDLLKEVAGTDYKEYYNSLYYSVKYGTDSLCKRIKEEIYR